MTPRKKIFVAKPWFSGSRNRTEVLRNLFHQYFPSKWSNSTQNTGFLFSFEMALYWMQMRRPLAIFASLLLFRKLLISISSFSNYLELAAKEREK